MGRVLTGRPLNLILRMLLGVMFVFAAWSKVADPHAFAISVRAYKMIPVAFSNLFALGLSWAELITGILLITGFKTRKAAGSAFILLAMFSVAIATTVIRGMVIDCGCFGSHGSNTGPLLLLRNVALLACAFLVMRYNDGFAAIDGALHPARSRASETV